MKNDTLIISHYMNKHPEDAARILTKLEAGEVVSFLNDLNITQRVALLLDLEPEFAGKCLEQMNGDKAAEVVNLLPRQRAIVLLRLMNVSQRSDLLDQLPQGTAHSLSKMLNYPENSAGGLADSVILSLPETMSAKEARERLKGTDDKSIYYVYLVSESFTLTGVLDLRDLLRSSPERTISSMMHRNLISIPAEMPFKAMLGHPAWQDFHVLPVVTSEGILLGAITLAMLRRMEQNNQDLQQSGRAVAASNALADLYRIGFMSMLPGGWIAENHTKNIKN